MALSYDNILGYVNQTINEIKEEIVFAVLLKKYKWRASYDIQNVLLCLAMHKLGLPINSIRFQHLKNTSNQNANRILHVLGDKKILTLKRNQRKILTYEVCSLFLTDIGWMEKKDVFTQEGQKGIWGNRNEGNVLY